MKKQLIELDKEDFIKNPVWEHWYENNIEFAKPTNKIELSDEDNKGYLVKSTFTLNNGKKLIGFCSPIDTSGIDYIQPVILTSNGHFNLYKDEDWSENEIQKEINKLGVSTKEIFPINLITEIKINREYYSCVIKNFNRI